MNHHTILGIETSCDETGVAIYKTGHGIISHALFSQIQTHQQFGGVIPELASRQQLEKINAVTKEAFERAKLCIDDIDTIAVTNRPGLPGSLLVGIAFAKGLAWSANKKIIGVNHLEGHAFSAFLEHDIPFPHLCITASGGHTSLYLVNDFGDYTTIGTTHDDAAGEAFDKIAKLLNLAYPGGPVIEKMAQEIGFQDFFAYPRATKHSLDFSFSGLKTAVLYSLVKHGAYDLQNKKFLKDDDYQFKQQVASSLLVAIADTFQEKVALALKQYPQIKALTFVGGVACNKYIKNRLQSWATSNNLPFFVPSPTYCTDNGAMIAFVGAYKAQKGLFDDFTLDINL